MLELQNITKEYPNGDSLVHALRGISVCFRKNEFVSVLGPSGCGKTTLLNIIGGLDRYTKAICISTESLRSSTVTVTGMLTAIIPSVCFSRAII